MSDQISITIKPASKNDFEPIYEIFKTLVSNKDSFVYEPHTSKEDVYDFWFGKGITTFVAEDRGWVLGAYKLNQYKPGLASHLASAGFIVAPGQQGRGIGTLMLKHCLIEATKAGFSAMILDSIVAENQNALRLWSKFGFSVIGTIPNGFHYKNTKFVDMHILYKNLHGS